MQTILIVDDDPSFRLMLRQILEREKYHVIEANSGEGALKVFRTTVPDMAILDVHMQGMNGFAVCKMLRNDPYGGSIPIIFLSGMIGDDDVIHGLQEGADDYILKPFNVKQFTARIQAHLARAKRNSRIPTAIEKQFHPGVIIDGHGGEKYKIESRLASGGMGVIFMGERLSDHLRVVIKTLNSSFLNNYKDIQRFLREANATISLKHPHIAEGIEVVRGESYCFFVMSFG